MKSVALIVTLSLAMLSACGSQPVEKRKYTLHPVALETATPAAPTIELGRIDLAPYLGHEGIVVETADGEVINAKHNLWAEPLSYSIRRYLQVQVHQLTGEPVSTHSTRPGDVAYTIDVLIHQLHGTESGTVKMVATWRIGNSNTDEAAIEHEFVATEKLIADGYPALVQGHKLLLNALAKEIATGISALPKPE
jgi:uncharacterized lipoprotein YmbA